MLACAKFDLETVYRTQLNNSSIQFGNCNNVWALASFNVTIRNLNFAQFKFDLIFIVLFLRHSFFKTATDVAQIHHIAYNFIQKNIINITHRIENSLQRTSEHLYIFIVNLELFSQNL